MTSTAPDDVPASPATPPPSTSSTDDDIASSLSSTASLPSSAQHRKSISDVPENVANACCTPAADTAQNLTSDVNCNDFSTKTEMSESEGSKSEGSKPEST